MKRSRSAIDWQQLRERLACAGKTAEDSQSASERRTRALRQQAQRLARRRRETVARAKTAVLAFRVGEELCGVELRHVAEVHAGMPLTAVPGEPEALLGVTYLHGQVRSVIDLGRLLGAPPTGATSGYVILLRGSEASFALRVDQLLDIRGVDLDQTVGTFTSEGDRSGGLVRGLTADGLSLVEPEAILSHYQRLRSLPSCVGEVRPAATPVLVTTSS